jgi:hypothetical protein
MVNGLDADNDVEDGKEILILLYPCFTCPGSRNAVTALVIYA